MNNEIPRDLKEKKEEEAKQLWIGVSPSAKWCKSCIHALPDTQYTIGAKKAYCDMFQPPGGKPTGVLCNDAECDYYEERDFIMTINQFCEFMNLPEMEKLGSLDGFIWYIEKITSSASDGLPMMVRENIKTNIFEILNSDQVFEAMDLFM